MVQLFLEYVVGIVSILACGVLIRRVISVFFSTDYMSIQHQNFVTKRTCSWEDFENIKYVDFQMRQILYDERVIWNNFTKQN